MSHRDLLTVLFLAACLSTAAACSETPSAKSAADLLACEANALVPLAPSVDAAIALAKDVHDGEASLGEALATLKASAPEALAAAKRFKACTAAKPAAADAGAP